MTSDGRRLVGSMLRRCPAVAMMAAVVGGVTITGCSKRAVTTTGWTAPAPTAGAEGNRGPASPSGPSAAGTQSTPVPSSRPSAQSDSEQPGTDDRRAAARPSVTEFAPVFDLVDVHFQFDRYDIAPAEMNALDSNARWLRSNRDLVLIEGHCDERGTSEYNLALGERRAVSAMNYLVSQGVAANRITIVSYGKERPQCTEDTDSCRQRNRRAHFLVKRQ